MLALMSMACCGTSWPGKACRTVRGRGRLALSLRHPGSSERLPAAGPRCDTAMPRDTDGPAGARRLRLKPGPHAARDAAAPLCGHDHLERHSAASRRLDPGIERNTARRPLFSGYRLLALRHQEVDLLLPSPHGAPRSRRLPVAPHPVLLEWRHGRFTRCSYPLGPHHVLLASRDAGGTAIDEHEIALSVGLSSWEAVH